MLKIYPKAPAGLFVIFEQRVSFKHLQQGKPAGGGTV